MHVRDVVLVNNGSHVACCTGDGTICLWDVESGKRSELLPVSDREMLALAAQPNGKLLAVSGMAREIILFDTESHSEVASAALPYSGFSTLSFASDGKYLAAGSRSGEVRVYATGNWDEPIVELTESDVQVADLIFVPHAYHLAIAYSSGNLSVLDIRQSDKQIAPFNSIRRHLRLRLVVLKQGWSWEGMADCFLARSLLRPRSRCFRAAGFQDGSVQQQVVAAFEFGHDSSNAPFAVGLVEIIRHAFQGKILKYLQRLALTVGIESDAAACVSQFADSIHELHAFSKPELGITCPVDMIGVGICWSRDCSCRLARGVLIHCQTDGRNEASDGKQLNRCTASHHPSS